MIHRFLHHFRICVPLFPKNDTNRKALWPSGIEKRSANPVTTTNICMSSSSKGKLSWQEGSPESISIGSIEEGDYRLHTIDFLSRSSVEEISNRNAAAEMEVKKAAFNPSC